MKIIKLHGHDFELKNLTSQYNRYLNSDKFELSDCYGRWSMAKQRAYDYCVKLAIDCGCFTCGIVSYNTCTFTFGFVFECDDMTWYAHLTRDHDYVMALA